MKRLILNGDTSLSFVAQDLQILHGHYDVEQLQYRGPKDLSRVYRSLRKADILLNWFADTPAFVATAFARWLRRPSIVIVGAYEVANEPEIDYGLQAQGGIRARLRRRQLRWTLARADLTIAGSEFSKREILQVARPHAIRVIPHGGIDGQRFRPDGPRERLVTTVASVRDRQAFGRKAIPEILACARSIPTVPFQILGNSPGEWAAKMRAVAPANVRIVGALPPEALLKEYQRSKVYLQPSRHESFGVAVAEAMACACIPVVSDRGALPEVVGDSGYVVPFGSPTLLAEAVRQALDSEEGGRAARERVLQRFSLEARARALVGAVDQTLRVPRP